jgi:hypothetical protein
MNSICIVQNVTPEFQGLHKREDVDYGIMSQHLCTHRQFGETCRLHIHFLHLHVKWDYKQQFHYFQLTNHVSLYMRHFHIYKGTKKDNPNVTFDVNTHNTTMYRISHNTSLTAPSYEGLIDLFTDITTILDASGSRSETRGKF